ncbi:conjugal transfer protein TrbE [Undibacterium arcticum]
MIHSLNLTHLIPTTAAWPGPKRNQCPFYPKNSPPLFYAATTGNAPFRVSLHVGDVGHTLILGPTGAGKSTLLEFMEAQHLRYKNAKLFKFEKGYSSFVLCNALGGTYYDIGGEHQQYAFCPLARVHNASERIWAEGYIEVLLELQGFKVTSAHRIMIRDAMNLLASTEADRRTMTDFVATLQDEKMQQALQFYTLDGGNQILDARSDSMHFDRVSVFEMEHLMNMGEMHVVPILLYLFRCVERQLDGSPVMLVLDEAWLMLSHKLFQEKIREWLKVMRKANCAVVFATQSISDVGNSPIRDVIYQSCLTKILLPNAEARINESCNEQYRLIGMNERQIDMLAYATPKQDYYYLSSLGRRMFRLGLGPVCMSFVGASGKEDVAMARHLMETHGKSWPAEWLRINARKPWGRGLERWATVLDYELREAA